MTISSTDHWLIPSESPSLSVQVTEGELVIRVLDQPDQPYILMDKKIIPHLVDVLIEHQNAR